MRRGPWAALLVVLCACSSDRVSRHASASTWGAGVRAQAQDPWQWGSEVVLLAALPVAAVLDDEIREAAADDDAWTDGGRHFEDQIADALTLTPLALGLWEWGNGDDARALEVAIESVAGTLLATEALKELTGRERPDESSDASFPSGHTSRAFAGATFLGRYVDQRWDSDLGYLAWLPATAVGLARVQHDRHWASDVVAGALLGTFLTNLVWNAHYGPGEGAIFAQPAHVAWTLTPIPLEDGLALRLSISL